MWGGRTTPAKGFIRIFNRRFRSTPEPVNMLTKKTGVQTRKRTFVANVHQRFYPGRDNIILRILHNACDFGE